jgi:protein gp37
MAETSTIEWTDATWNPITGCTLVSEGCRHCYAATLAATRLKNHPSRSGLARINAAGEAKFTGEVRLNEDWLDQPLCWRGPRMIFVCAHGDLFHEAVPDEWIDRVFAVMALAPRHTFQVLTKRPERARAYFDGRRANFGRASEVLADMDNYLSAGDHQDAVDLLDVSAATGKPMPNVWLGTSVEDQSTADARIPHLLATPAAVRFVSAEPLLGPVLLDDMCDGVKFVDALGGKWWHDSEPPHIECGKPRLDWVIVGGESGKHARPMHPKWARSLRDQCVSTGVPFFFKQWGEWVSVSEVEGPGDHFRFPDGATVRRTGKALAGRTLDGQLWDQMPAQKGGAA